MIQPMNVLSTTFRNKQTTPETHNNYIKESPINNQQTWMKIYGGMADDKSSAIYQTTDGGYIIVGTTSSFGPGFGRNIWLLKLDATGNEEWNNTYGGIYPDTGDQVQQTTDGGYIIIGWTNSFDVDDLFIVKTDANGVEQWHRTYGGPEHDFGDYVLETDDGYLLLGSTYSYGAGNADIWLIKTDSRGIEFWNKTIGTSKDEYCDKIIKLDHNGYILVGTRVSDMLLIKIDNQGNEEWSKMYQDIGSCDIQLSPDGGYYILGVFSFNDTYGWGSILLRVDSNGNIIWSKIFEKMDFRSFQKTNDDGFVLIGYKESLLYGYEILLTKIKDDGRIQWSRTYGTWNTDWGHYVQQTSDEGYVIVGDTYVPSLDTDDVVVIKTNEKGRITNFANPCQLINFAKNKLFQNFL